MSAKPSILFLASWYPVPSNPTHGIFIKNHAKALSAFAKVTVVYAVSDKNVKDFTLSKNKDGNLSEYILLYPKSKINLILIKQFDQFLNYRKAYKALLDQLIKDQINITDIQVNVAFPVAMALSIFKNHYHVPHTVAEHWSGYLPEDGNYKGFIQKYFTRLCFRNASKIWHVSNRQKQCMNEHGLTGNYELLYNAVDTDIFKNTGKNKLQKTTLLHVSSLVEKEKNISQTFEALKNIEKSGQLFELIIIGGNEETINEAKKLQEKLQLHNITYLGQQPKEVISEYMNKCHALLLFSNFEGMPVVVLEALACELPVICSNVGHIPDIIDPDMGIVVNKNNVTELTQGLENFLSGKHKFDTNKMRAFILKNASYNSVGLQMFEHYKH